MKGKRARARMIRAEALALSAMMATMNVMPALADSGVNLEVGIEASSEGEGERDKDLASSSNATPVKEEDNIDKEIETEENEEDSGDFEFEEELENDLETEESTENLESSENENLEDTESSESGKESLEDTENENEIESSGAEENTEESSESETEDVEESTEEELDSEEVDLATPSNAEKLEPETEPELMTLSLNEVVYGEWNDSEDGNWQFLPSEDGTCSIKPLSEDMKTGDVVVPEEIDGFTVTNIVEGAWQSCENLKSITLPDSITSIGKAAFNGCTSLTEANIPNVKTIGNAAFSNCSSLTEVSIPNVTSIDGWAFSYCESLTSIDMLSVTSIGNATFEYCKLLTQVDIPNVKTIGNSSFSNCSSLTQMDIPNVSSIKNSAFNYCTSLTEVNMPNVTSIENYAFKNCKSLKQVDIPNVKTIGTEAFKDCSLLTQVDMPNVTSIGESAFIYCKSLKQVDIPNVKTIRNSVFCACTSLTGANMPNVTSIGERAFGGCSSLIEANMPNVTSIGVSAFSNCSSLIEANISNVKTIRDNTFKNCSSLPQANMPNVTSIGESAFEGCSSLTQANMLNVTSIGNCAFKNCSSLPQANMPNVTSIGQCAFNKCSSLTEVSMDTIESLGKGAFSYCENLSTLNWTNKLKALPDFAFYKCGKLTSFDLGEVESIGIQALFGCNSIKELTIPASVESVYLTDLPGEYDYSGKADFSRGYKLTFLGDTDFKHYKENDNRYGKKPYWWLSTMNDNIDLSDSIIINELVLPSKDCKAYKKITDRNNSDEIPLIDDTKDKVIYHAVNNYTKLEYEDMGKQDIDSLWEKMKALKDNDDTWNQHIIIGKINVNGEVIEATTNKSTVTFYVNDGTDTIYKTEEVEEGKTLDLSEKPEREGYEFIGWYKDTEGKQPIDENEPINNETTLYAKWKKVVAYGEWNTSEDKLWEIFPQEDGTCSIRPLADIVKTGSVVVPEEEDGFTVISIAESAWNNSSNLTEINMSGIKVIGNSAFYGSGLTSVTLDNVDTISDSAFRNCTGLTELNIGSVGTIESSSFAECDNLTNVNINEVSGTVKEYAFNNSGVETITIDRINNAEYNSLVAKEKITIGYAENLNGAKAKNIEITSGNNVMCGNYWPSNYAGNSNNICETITIGDVTGTVKAFAFNNITIESADNIIADADVVDIKNANTITKVNGREVNITEVNYLQNITDADYENSWRINGTHEIEKLNITHVGEIDNRCFYDNENLNTVIIESAGTIGDSAFEDCSALSDLQIGTVDKIGRMAFSGCSSLETLTTQDLGEIGESAFIITGLRTINLGNVNKIGVGAFYSLSNLETVNIGNVEEIREDAFAHNMALKTVTMGEINEMGARAFERCTELETVNWTCKLETLPERAFYYDGKLKSIDLGSDLKSVGYKALFKCNSIKELTIPAGVDTVNFVDLCGEYDYSGEADFSRGYKLTFLGDNTDFEIRYGEENVLGDNDDSIIINELILPSKESKAYKRITSVDNTDIINTIDGERSNVVYHAVAKNTKATYKTGSININGVISDYNMLTPYSDGNMGKEVDWSWWSIYKDIGNKVGDSSNVGGQGTGRVIQHTIIPVLKIGDEIIDGSTGDKKETVTVRFWKNDGTDTIVDEQEIEKGTKDVNTSDPYLSGYWFVGWYLEPECINSATNGYGDSRIDVEDLTTDLDVYARWEKEYKIIKYLDKEDGEILKEVKEYNGESIDIDKEAPEIELGQWEDLRGWKEIRYTMKLYIINGYMISINIEEYIPEIEYIPPKEMISIVYYINDGTDRIFHFDDIEKGKTLGLISEKPEREGYEFTGWYYEPECENKVPETARFEKDTRLYAGWKEIETEPDKKEKITVTFYNNDNTDTIFKTQQIEKGKTVNTNDKPNRDKYEFTGWYLEPECVNRVTETTTFENDSNVYAGWKKKDTGSSSGDGEIDVKEKITITYYLNDGTEDIFKREQIEKGGSPDMSVEPSRKGYEFKGWFYEAEGENKVPENITVEEDTNFYAKWEKIDSGSETPDNPDDKEEKIKVTYYENDGTPDIYKTEKIEKGDTPDTSGEPEREGYEFKGWYEEPECETPVDPSKPLEEDTDFYAKWEKKDTDPSGNDKPDDKNEDDKKPEDKPNDKNEDDKKPEDKPNDKNEDDKKPEDKPNDKNEDDNKTEDKTEKVKVTYHNNDDTDKIYKTEEIDKGGTPDTEGNPDREKYEFTGWYLDPECKVPVDPSKPLDKDTDLYAGWKKKDTIPTGNGSRGGGGSHGGSSSTVTVVNVHEDKPEPEKKTIDENGVPQGETDKEEVNTTTLDENGVPRDKAEKEEQDNIDSLPKTGDKRNIFIYWITFMSSLSSIMFMGLKDKMRSKTSKEKTENKTK